MPNVPEHRAVVVWKPPNERPEAVEARETDRRLAEARKAEADARLAQAKTKETNALILRVGADLVLSQLRKWLEMASHPDFANSVGPLDPKDVLKLAEFVQKNHRLDTGQATEHVAHVVAATVDFGSMTQEERDKWRELATKYGGTEGGE